MSLAELIEQLPDYASDQKLNLAALAAETILTEQQKWGCFLACALATGERSVIRAVESETQTRLSEDAKLGAQRAAAVMAMNTVYYRAINLLQNHDYRSAPVNLNMSALSNAAIDKVDFELWALAVSAMHGCGSCLNAHESDLHRRGVSLERILAAIRIAAVVNAMSHTIRAEEARRPGSH